MKEKPLVYVLQDVRDVFPVWSDHDSKHFFTEFLEHCDKQAGIHIYVQKLTNMKCCVKLWPCTVTIYVCMYVCVHTHTYIYISGWIQVGAHFVVNLTHCTLRGLQNPISHTAYSDPAMYTYRKK
jgi:hypothetical protein